jgi:hypothetical protein
LNSFCRFRPLRLLSQLQPRLRTRIQLVLVAGVCGVSGCASQQRIALQYPKAESLSGGALLAVVDLRTRQERGFHGGGSPHCYRSYGDDFFAPPKLTYLQHVVETRVPANTKVQLTVSRFETLEYCDGTVARTRPLGIAAVTAEVTGGKVVLPADVPNAIKGDTFILRISGTINSKPFDISEQFDYDDIAFTSFPSENPEYRMRIQHALDEAVNQLLGTAPLIPR